MKFQNTWPSSKVLGSKLMTKSLDLLVRTQGYGIPWRRNLLTLSWLIGLCIFWGGPKMNLIDMVLGWSKVFNYQLSVLKFR